MYENCTLNHSHREASKKLPFLLLKFFIFIELLFKYLKVGTGNQVQN